MQKKKKNKPYRRASPSYGEGCQEIALEGTDEDSVTNGIITSEARMPMNDEFLAY